MKNRLYIVVLFIYTISSFAQTTTKLNLEDEIPSFFGLDDQGNEWNSSNVKSEFLVVYFYPAAMTGGCTKQACAYRDDKVTFDNLGVTVIGVSGDEVNNIKHFKKTYQLNFPLISDTKGNIAKIFGVPTKNGGSITRKIGGETFLLVRGVTTPRWTFVLDKDRKIIYINAEVNASQDSNKVQEIIRNYSKN